MSNKKYYLSFFSGALGLDTGLEEAGMIPLMYNEYDKKIVPTIKANKPDVELFDCETTSARIVDDKRRMLLFPVPAFVLRQVFIMFPSS